MPSIAGILGGMTQEEKNENIKREERKIALLKAIADGMGGGKEQGGGKPKGDGEEAGKGISGWFGGILTSILGGAKTALMAGLKMLLSPARLFKLLVKAFPIAMIIGSLFNGIWEAFKVWQDGGSIGEMIAAFMGGILEFLSFGLLDAEAIKDGIMSVFGWIDDYIITPISDLFTWIGDTIGAIGDYISNAWDKFTNFFGFGDDTEEELEENKDRAQANLTRAQTSDAVGRDADGNIIYANRTVNGVADVAGAEARVLEMGGTLLTDEERAALIAENQAAYDQAAAELEAFKNLPTLGGMFSEYVLDPLSNMWDGIKEWFSEGLDTIWEGIQAMWETVSGLWSSISDLIYENIIQPIADVFNEYVVEPFKSIIEPVADWFSSVMEELKSFFEDFGIPEISFDIPLYGEVKFGPWYPFRGEGSDAGTEHVSATDSVETKSEKYTDEEGNQIKDYSTASHSYIKSLGSSYDGTGEGAPVLEDDRTKILVQDDEMRLRRENGEVVEHSSQANSAYLEFNARTGESTYNGQEIGKDVYRAGKRAAEKGGKVADIELAMAREEAYNRLNWWNTAKALAGDDPIALLSEQEGQQFDVASLLPSGSRDGETLNEQSVAVADGNRPASSTTANVVAPTTAISNNTTNQVARQPVRNGDQSLALANGFAAG